MCIRLHPSEKKEKYDVIVESNPNLFLSVEDNLIYDIFGSHKVFGCESAAMAVGIMLRKEVISIIPPGGRPCSLPHKEIVYARDML